MTIDDISYQRLTALIANQKSYINALVEENKLTEAIQQINVLEGILLVKHDVLEE